MITFNLIIKKLETIYFNIIPLTKFANQVKKFLITNNIFESSMEKENKSQNSWKEKII